MTGAFGLVLPLLACLLLFRRIEPAGHWLAALAWAAPFAIGASSLTWWFLLHSRIQSWASLIAVDAAIWLGATAALLGRPAAMAVPGMPLTPSDRTTWVAGTILAVTIVVAAMSFVGASTVYPHGEWDAWAIWNLRARFLSRLAPFEWHDAFPPLLAWSHLDYPPLLSLSVARAWTYAGGESTAIPAGLAAMFALGAAVLAGTAVARWDRHREAAYGRCRPGLTRVRTVCPGAMCRHPPGLLPARYLHPAHARLRNTIGWVAVVARWRVGRPGRLDQERRHPLFRDMSGSNDHQVDLRCRQEQGVLGPLVPRGGVSDDRCRDPAQGNDSRERSGAGRSISVDAGGALRCWPGANGARTHLQRAVVRWSHLDWRLTPCCGIHGGGAWTGRRTQDPASLWQQSGC